MNHRQAETTRFSSVPFSAYACKTCFHTLFEAQANCIPDAVALVFQDEQLTYRELNRRTSQLAHYIQKLGVGPEVPVGIYLERSAEMVVSLLAVLKANGAYLPLDPAYPGERLAFMLQDSQAPIVLTRQQLAKNLPPCNAQIVCLDTHWAEIAQQEADTPTSGVTPDNLAYIIYTSGSTGKPKGVLVPHRGLPNVFEAQMQNFGIGFSDRVLQFASLSFDASIFEIVMALGAGATLCLGTQEDLLPGPNLAQWLRDLSATIFTLTPSALAALPATELPALRTITVAGEACPADLVARWADGRRFFNLYGPTEATIWATVAKCRDGGQKPPIGHPIANVQVYVLDSQLQPVTSDTAGELHIGGVGLARGYLNRSGLSAARFIPDPFSDEPGARLYKTGDWVRYWPDGELEFLDRIDQQVKVRGFRIELLEIETLLRQHPALREAVVLAREDTPGHKHLVAYVVPVDEGTRTKLVGELRSYLKQNLPEYMLPSAFVTLQVLPLTTSGKVNRQALPAPARARLEMEETFVAPRTPVEEQLAQIWSQVLGYEQIGVHDSFFNLGGHSLALTQVLSRLSERFRVELPIARFFETPSVSGLAEHIQRARQTKAGPELPAITPVPRDAPLPLTFAQEQVWFLQELAPGNVAYNAQVTVRFKGKLDVATFERALSEIVRRHEILRTTVSAAGGQPVQIFHPPWTVKLPLVDLRAIPENRREIEMERLVKAASRRPFDTTQLPLIRWTLFRLGTQDHVFAQIEHHFVHDGWSFAVLLRELKTLYQAFVAGKPSPLAELPFQFADFAAWQRRWMQGEVLQTQLAYWKKQLAGSPPMLELPTDRPRPKLQSFQGAAHRITLSPPLHQALKALNLREGVTLFMTLLAALKVLLYRYTGQQDILIGSGLANRRLRQTEGLIGMIVNAVVLRTDLSGNPTFRELLGRVREAALGAYEHQELPFEKLVEALQPERDLSRNPLFQVMFSFHDSAVPELEFAGLTGTIQYRQNDSAKCDLNVLVIPRAEQLLGQSSTTAEKQLTIIWEYDTDLFDAATIERLARHFQVLLTGIVATPESLDRRISALSLLTDAEQRQLLGEWNGTETDYSQDKCIHELFEAQVEQTPDAVVVIFDDQHLTCQELSRRGNQLAHYLRGLRVGPDMPVGIYMDRSLELIVGILGVLKAGGAYLPLDLAYPVERLAFMLEDSQAQVLITRKRLLENLSHHVPGAICLDSDWEIIARESYETVDSQVTADNLAYIIYTSGSTGKPKGGLISHNNAARLFEATNRWFNFDEHDVWTLFHTHAFDFSVWEIWGALLYGGRLVIVPYMVTRSPQEFYNLLYREQVTVLNQTPSAFRQLIWVEESLDAAADLTLRLVIFGGEALELNSLRPWYDRHSDQRPRLINMYGITETTVHVTYRPLTLADLATPGSLIGNPILDLQLYILDQHLQLVPIGVAGEIHVGGVGLARGYLNRPDLSAERFIPNPFSAKPGARLYKSGDLGRHLSDGDIEYLGRIDHQVKVRGFRIELGEIEALLNQHPAVHSVAVLVREDNPGDSETSPPDKRLIAYYVSKEEPAITNSELRDYLQSKLPGYMIPAAFVHLDIMPLTPNGKVDRRALPAPDQSDQKTAEPFVAPRSLSEEALADIWAEVLGLERVSVHDDFFALGGHSLLATRIVSRLRDDLQVKIRLRDFFERPTVAQLALAVEDVLLAELETLTDQEAQHLIEGE